MQFHLIITNLQRKQAKPATMVLKEWFSGQQQPVLQPQLRPTELRLGGESRECTLSLKYPSRGFTSSLKLENIV